MMGHFMSSGQKKKQQIQKDNDNLKIHEQSVQIANVNFKKKLNKMTDIKLADDRRCII